MKGIGTDICFLPPPPSLLASFSSVKKQRLSKAHYAPVSYINVKTTVTMPQATQQQKAHHDMNNPLETQV